MPAATLADVRLALEKGNTVCTGKKTGWAANLLGRIRQDTPEDGAPPYDIEEDD